MITRIVKMRFQEDKISIFWEFIQEYKTQIRNFPGCLMVEFLQDVNDPTIIMTHSQWDNTEDLENYRKSALFEKVWANTKIHFEQKAEANTFNALDKL